MATLEWRVPMPVSARELYDWHARPGAFERLLPPWEDIEVLEHVGTVEDGARLVMKLRKGPVSLRWHALHRDHIEGEQFVDVQVKGPFGKWVHTHRFLEEGEHSSILHDHIEYRLPLAPLSTFFGAGFARREVERLFTYRHERTRRDLERHAQWRGPRLRIAVTGASGFVGTALCAFLTTGGHDVVRLVRKNRARATETESGPRTASHSRDGTVVRAERYRARGHSERPAELEVTWDPKNGELDPSALEGIDALIHLAGENVGERRWTPEVKREIRDSRVRSNELLAKTVAAMRRPPEVLIVAGGTGIYGARGEERIDEDSSLGDGFLADVGRASEAAWDSVDRTRTRVVPLRIGLVLGAHGGVLSKLTPLFRCALGGPLGNGRQGVAWIGLDDLVAVIHRAIFDGRLDGPVNAVAGSVSNQELAKTLGRVLSRPAVLPAPAAALRAGLGERADALLLSGAYVEPKRLTEAGFELRNGDLESALCWELQGRST
ncbi:MAG: TIGR01777 family oxidoreductase [Planctomycetota bacterium]